MKSEQIAQEIRLSEWAKDIKECRASGMTVKDWCASKGISINTYRYRYRRLRMIAGERIEERKPCSETAPVSFVPVSPSVQRAAETGLPAWHACIRLTAGGKTLELPQTIPLEYFKAALEVFSDAE